ncbi:hypothetical protein NliqN6_4253 [Naganishia liquefaciens]|uniref:Uncharacterized protein n=1 Tax=Naganishia liquefaciens TaxID=104408 RepID=A0A8H3YHQ6_9TREE|nr:hypothetical protein NliqN6_4253 [Naganishia liquefaciens]
MAGSTAPAHGHVIKLATKNAAPSAPFLHGSWDNPEDAVTMQVLLHCINAKTITPTTLNKAFPFSAERDMDVARVMQFIDLFKFSPRMIKRLLSAPTGLAPSRTSLGRALATR